MIQNFPPEILVHIFRYACVDEGVTARSLSLTSKYVSSASSRFLFNTLYLARPDSLQCALHCFSSLPPQLREVCHLFIADKHGEFVDNPKAYPIFHDISPDLFSQFLLLTAPTLRNLTIVIREDFSGFLESITHTTMPNLTNLTLSLPTCVGIPLPNPAPRKANFPQLRHLHIDARGCFPKTVGPVVTLLTPHAPRLSTLHITDVTVMPGCAYVLAHMLGRVPLRDIGSWVVYDDVLDRIARIPFSVREFTLQVRDWPMSFTKELALIQRMARMDYGDGFVLLPKTPMRDYQDWKEEWLATARLIR